MVAYGSFGIDLRIPSIMRMPRFCVVRARSGAQIVYAVWASGDVYDEARHIEQLKRHEVKCEVFVTPHTYRA